MKTLLTHLVRATALLALTTSVAFAKPGWSENYAKASAEAKADKKLLLIDFTGSDWCGWCMKLDKEVFSQPEFAEYAKSNLVLVEADFPQKKELPAAVKAQNEKLAANYHIKGYPTIIVLNGAGKKVAELGYMPGGPKAFIAELEKLKGK